MPLVGLWFAVTLGECLRHVCLVHDVIAVKHRPRLPAYHLHHDFLWHTGVDEFSRGSASEIVQPPSLQPGSLARRLPDLVKGSHALTVPVEDKEPVSLLPPLLRSFSSPSSDVLANGMTRASSPFVRSSSVGGSMRSTFDSQLI